MAKIIGLLALSAITALIIGTSRTGAAATPPGLTKVSNLGGPATPLAATEALAAAAARSGITVTAIRSLGTVAERSFYRVVGTPCFAVGPGLNGQQLAAMFCNGAFPSGSVPVMVRLTRFGDDHAPATSLVAEGFAADAVASVALVGPDGSTVASSPVSANVFRLSSSAPETTSAFVALDRNGNQIYSTPTAG